MEAYETFFQKMNRLNSPPYQWQHDLAETERCGNRLIRIPTGFGKTLGVFAAWLWHRVRLEDDSWPRRLVWCLPMRVLVEQTAAEIRNVLERCELPWKDGGHENRIGVHVLMGGADSGQWHLFPEEHAVLIGTQDMLLSRAMNRGYGCPRARWPMEFGMLNHDCLWVLDEVQLMDVGLATATQIQAFREDDRMAGRMLRPCCTWWMSATLQPEWLQKSPDTLAMAESIHKTSIEPAGRVGHLWDDVSKPFRLARIETDAALARLVEQEINQQEAQSIKVLLVVVNRVERAVAVYQALSESKALVQAGVDIRLIHSRFRPRERSAWTEDFLNRQACESATRRIIVSTQVIEAGVDISADLLITELAPWASLVQRFGRCARWGGNAKVIVVDFDPKEDKAAAPYTKTAVDASRGALGRFEDRDVAPGHLELFEESHRHLLERLYPFDPTHLLLRHEMDELFDTTPDLSGADIDISRFIRSGDERDLQVFWHLVPPKETPDKDLQPARDALCSIPFLKARDWLCGAETQSTKRHRLKENMRAWVWDWLDGTWRRANRTDLIPGCTVLVAADCGGYDPKLGWTPESRMTVTPVDAPKIPVRQLADAALENESSSIDRQWQTIATHGREVGRIARQIAEKIPLANASLFHLAGRLHDVGKCHPAFNNSIRGSDKPDRNDLAKAPKEAWLSRNALYPMPGETRRAGFRHELASALAMFSVLRRFSPDHPALLGPWRSFLVAAGFDPPQTSEPTTTPNALENEILHLDAHDFDLVAYLVCAHHGKARLAWHSSPADQAANDEKLRIMGLKEGDEIPPVTLVDSENRYCTLAGFAVDLGIVAAGLDPRTGRSWTERVLRLIERYGPFALAWQESLFRAADQRASRLSISDELLDPEKIS